ncbi:tail fiber protein [Chitinivorax sp. B]|uniref:phage tail protein n=1 Tax=Chitinivorax sp. B TaxID=2502235 RepID=UPI00201776CE|nr:tail fiber protein [Chitinivorax sp. B]
MIRMQHHLLISTVLLVTPLSATLACSSEPILGSICTVGFTFCPRGWAEANGQLLSIAQNTALFALLGTTYGGNGQTTFALPDLRGRAIAHTGQGPGLSNLDQGQVLGSENTTLIVNNLPPHNHSASSNAAITAKLRGSSGNGSTDSPAGGVLAKQARTNIYGAGPADTDMGPSAIAVNATVATTTSNTGGGQPFDNHQPTLVMRQCIALEGIFPSRN